MFLDFKVSPQPTDFQNIRPLNLWKSEMALSEIDQNSRFEKSLGLLTTRFVTLLQEAEDGVLDLKVVSEINMRS